MERINFDEKQKINTSHYQEPNPAIVVATMAS